MGTASGANTRRYHGLLVATVLLAAIEAHATVDGEAVGLSTNQYVGAVHPKGFSRLESFSCGEAAEWTFAVGGAEVVKTVRLVEGANACVVEYRNNGSGPIALTLRPLVCHKFYHDNFRLTDFYPQFLVFPEGRTVLSHNDVQLTIVHPEADRTATTGWYYRFEHTREAERGLDPLDDLYCPCELRYVLGSGDRAVLRAYEGEEPAWPHEAPEARALATLEGQLEEAARHFVVRTAGRTTIVAGYPWFTDWGRDTAICVPGLLLARGLAAEARDVLSSLGQHMRDGLVPNRFPDRGAEPEFNTADATLWFVHAAWQTLEAEWDAPFAQQARAWIREALEAHLAGTRFGIGVDPADGLLSQGAPGYQLTWMDAKVGDWVVTPRHGKPVEVNGLWANALEAAARLEERLGGDPSALRAARERAVASFEAKFWNARAGHYLDTVDPDDASLRPNQLVAMALPYGPCRTEHARTALEAVRRELLTPNGLRSLAPGSPGYHPRYEGPMSERDAAYHQGTAWPWLLGPYVSAVLRHTGAVEECRALLGRARVWLAEYGLGGIAEVYDADPPQFPSGCPWQAWSVAEVLRALAELRAHENPETIPPSGPSGSLAD
jgi:glycogen debranching enzyme